MKKLSEFKTITERRKYIEDELQIDLSKVGSVLIDDESSVHCENVIGAITLPLGVAGPLRIKNKELRIKNYFIPLATTEGALVASVNRGCKAITESSGATVITELVGTTRGPVFQTSGLVESNTLKMWFVDNFDQIAKEAEKTSSHLHLLKIGTRIVGDRVFARFYYDTEEAMGMNMVTIATTIVCKMVEKEIGIKCIAVAGNFDIDKKPAWLNSISGRGRRVWAEVTLSKEIVEKVLKSTPQKIYDVWLSKCMIGSAISGSIGFNSHFANIVAALYAATGQDLAHTVEGSIGITTTKVMPDGGLYISIHLPAVMIGIVGGGTKLSTQQQARSICKVSTSDELAEILGGAVLAGELSLLASLAEGSLTKAHEKLGR